MSPFTKLRTPVSVKDWGARFNRSPRCRRATMLALFTSTSRNSRPTRQSLRGYGPGCAQVASFPWLAPVGESHYTHEPVSSILQRCDGDRCEARAAASGYALTLPTWSADTRRQVFDDWLDETADLVRINWRVITALAQRLALNGTLQAADVCRAIAMADRKAA
jgi:hypothetical protein